MNAEIISVGDELLIGQVINTNQAYIAEKLNAVGIFVDRMTTVGDNEPEILRAFESAFSSHDAVVVTGGLGPTHDDITRSAVCKFFQTNLVHDPEALRNVKELFERRKLAVTKLNEDQALVPRGCTVMQNSLGTAPGHFFEKDKKFFIVMPGVPSEMKGMMEGFVLPYFEKNPTGVVIRHRTLKTTGIAESHLAEQIGDVKSILDDDSGTTLAFLPSPMGVKLRITVRGKKLSAVEERIHNVEAKLRARAQKYLYAADDEELEHVVGRILTERKLTIAVAESCTGGLIADRLTDVPGSSNYFERAMITYSNDSKMAELSVPASFLEKFGAVSREVAEAMAFGIRTKSNTDIGLSTTGIAGPTGGSDEKPVGLVWIGYSDRHETIALRFNFLNDRRRVKERTAQAALELVRRKLIKIT
ncbi:MAG: competence/damage-inducible protein A [Ignavibacteriales bacterium]|nr:competence/damage-inducible protein A [Ignavibacteriales bacterium]